jgi:GT2 family glycosyltransferase
MRLAFVVVAYRSAGALGNLLPALGAQLTPGDRLIVVDNASSDESASVAEAHPAVTLTLRPGRNLGFAAGSNLGAAYADADAVVFLNPDCIPEARFVEAMRRPPPDWGAWMGLVTLADGERVNTAGGIAHFLGLAWAGQLGAPIAEAPSFPAPVGFLSGACLAVRREVLDEVGGFHEPFFMYGEDVDLSHRLRLAGHHFGVIPAARVRHDYAFGKGDLKWRLLERNRWLLVLRTYPAALLAAVLPAMVLTEPALWVVAVRGGWARSKLAATGGVLRALPETLRERRVLQADRRVGAARFAEGLTPSLDSPMLARSVRSAPVQAAMRLYWGAVTSLLRWARAYH